MASTSSLGASSNASSKDAQSFYESFNATLRDVRRRIEEATTEVALSILSGELAQARIALTNATNQLPPYDRQIHEQHLREVNELLTQKHKVLVPKTKFAFKRKAKAEDALMTCSTKGDTSNHSSRSLLAVDSSITSDCLSIRNKKGQHLSFADLKGDSNESANDLHILELNGCVVDIRHLHGRSEFLALQLRKLQNTVVLCGRINGSVMIHECTNCILLVECKQFRMHSSTSMAVLLSTSSVATIEYCKDIQFAPLAASKPLPSVQDFDHITTNQHSSNWSVMPPGRQAQIHSMTDRPPQDAASWIDAADLACSNKA